MKIFYTLADALAYIKKEIGRLEEELRTAESPERKNSLERMIVKRLERGIMFYWVANPDERDPRILDFFLDRLEKRPDLEDFERVLKRVSDKRDKKC